MKGEAVAQQEKVGVVDRLIDLGTGRNMQWLRSVSMPLILLLLISFFAVTTPRFLSTNNLLKIVNNAAVGGTLALGMTFVLIIAGIDLSVGAVVTLTTVVLGVFVLRFPVNAGMAILLALLAGSAVGFLNGILVVKARVPALIVTLGTMSIVQSAASFITKGDTITLRSSKVISFLGQGYVGIVPVPALILIILATISYVVLNYTTFGAYIRAIGGNKDASILMGVDVALYQVVVYVLSGLMASLAGIMVAGRLQMGSSQAGEGLLLPAIAAAVLGGTSLFGGEGSVVGTLVGALILNVLFNGLILYGLPFFYQLVATGVILILAIALNEAIRERV